jgi:hypothetical protein
MFQSTPKKLCHRTGCYPRSVANRTEPKTVGQWIRYVVVAAIALFLVLADAAPVRTLMQPV